MSGLCRLFVFLVVVVVEKKCNAQVLASLNERRKKGKTKEAERGRVYVPLSPPRGTCVVRCALCTA